MTEESTVVHRAARRTTVVAFYSSADGTGRSSMTANIALMLGSQGYRVLVCDLNLADPSLHRYLAPFLPQNPHNAENGPPTSLSCRFEDPGGAVDFTGPLTTEVTGPERYRLRRADLVGRGYDVVVADLPATAEAAGLASELADVLVLGYTLNQQHMDRAEQLARTVQAGDRGPGIRVLPVPVRVDQNTSQITARRRVAAHRQFAWLLAGLPDEARQRYLTEVEIPYEAEYAVEEGLPFLDPPSPHRDRLVSAYLRLARNLLPALPDTLTASVTTSTLRRYRKTRRDAASRDSTVTIVHAAADRLWAEWIAATLGPMGFTPTRQRIDQFDPDQDTGGSTLMVVSAHLLRLPGLEGLVRRVISELPPEGQALVGITVDGRWLPASLFPTLGKISLEGKSPKAAHEELASYYQISLSPLDHNPVNYPGRPDRLTVNLPALARGPIGRDDLIDQVRDHFTGPGDPAPLSLTGPAGRGKTLVAVEYARRFGPDYDLIVYIRADSAEAIRADLATFALQVQPQRPAGDPGIAALEEASSASPPRRWLLIYAGADDPALLNGLIPAAGQGHVLLTAREAVRGDSDAIAVRPLTQAAAEAMVFDLIEEIAPSEAAWIAERMGRVPLAIRLACTWMQTAMAQAEEHRVQRSTLTEDLVANLRSWFETRTEDIQDPVRAVVDLHLAGLQQGYLGAAAILLLEKCAFLGSCGMSWRLLQSPQALAELAAADSAMSDPILLSSVFHEIASRGLLLDDAGLFHRGMARAPLRVHPSVLDAVRGRMSPAEQATRMQRVSQMLAASAPPDIDDDDVAEKGAIYGELMQHVGPSGAIAQTSDPVRQWLVNQVRFLWLTGSRGAWVAAAELAGKLQERWLAQLPGDGADRANDPLLLRLRTQLANVYRSLGRIREARDIDRDVLRRERAAHGFRHLRTLLAARSYGADLRWAGDFERALLEDAATCQLTVRAVGRDHLLAVLASGNLALAELLAGEPEQALTRRLEYDLPWCEQFEADRPAEAAWVLGHIGVLQRELGQYKAAQASLESAVQGFQRAAGGTSVPASMEKLRIDGDIASVNRRLGRPDPPRALKILEACQHIAGDTHPLVAAIRLSYAGDLHAVRDSARAIHTATTALAEHVAFFTADHPFTWVNQVDLSVYALAAGELAQADEVSQRALDALERSLGGGHLWTMAAVVARANALAITGRIEEAADLEARVLDEYRERFGPDHPFTRVAEENAQHTGRLRDERSLLAHPGREAGLRQAIELDIPPY